MYINVDVIHKRERYLRAKTGSAFVPYSCLFIRYRMRRKFVPVNAQKCIAVASRKCTHASIILCGLCIKAALTKFEVCFDVNSCLIALTNA